jgi:hypothetical protein
VSCGRAGSTDQRARADTAWLREPSVNSSTTRPENSPVRRRAATSRATVPRNGRGLQRNGRSTIPSWSARLVTT